jgi:hypothetical protein
MTQHTPGPWRVGKDGNIHETFLLAELRGIYTEKEANARLIAAAPELLAALRECALLAEYGTTGLGKCKSDALSAEKATALRLAVSTIARAAIAKAEGQS